MSKTDCCLRILKRDPLVEGLVAAFVGEERRDAARAGPAWLGLAPAVWSGMDAARDGSEKDEQEGF
jgi:hypothetical protein